MNSSVAAARLTGARPARHEVLADVILDDFRQQAVHGAAARGQQLHCMISRPMAHDLVCWKCGAPLAELTLPLRRLEECPQCHAELHVCRMCIEYDTRVAKHCREPTAEEVNDKTHANFCDHFKPRAAAFTPPNTAEVDKARTELEKLFGKG